MSQNLKKLHIFYQKALDAHVVNCIEKYNLNPKLQKDVIDALAESWIAGAVVNNTIYQKAITPILENMTKLEEQIKIHVKNIKKGSKDTIINKEEE